MPESAQDFYARVVAATDDEGRLVRMPPGIVQSSVFAYEVDGLRLKPMLPLGEAEPPRGGEDPADCRCAAPDDTDAPTRVWTGADFRVDLVADCGLPLMLLISSMEHFDLADLPRPLAAQLGELLVTIGAAMEALPSVARAQIGRFGDGGAHLHIFMTARPYRMLQLRGSFLLDWEEHLPRVPLEVLQDNARTVAAALVEHHGGSRGRSAGVDDRRRLGLRATGQRDAATQRQHETDGRDDPEVVANAVTQQGQPDDGR